MDRVPTMPEASSVASNKQQQQQHSVKQPALLRLFKSDMFSAWMALQYLLHTPPHDHGTHFYLCRRLARLPPNDIRQLVPQFVHLLVASPKALPSLECLVAEWCRVDVHVSQEVLWLLESYQDDALFNNQDSVNMTSQQRQRLMTRINRLLLQIQQASFARTDLIRHRHQQHHKRRRSSLLLGLSDSNNNNSNSTGVDELPTVSGTLLGFGLCLLSFVMPEAYRSMRPLALIESRPNCDFTAASSTTPGSKRILPIARPMVAPSVEELHRGDCFTNMASGDQKSISNTTRLYHPEQQFVSALLEVSKRIAIVPTKEARQRALYAELNLINHNLPAPICLPLQCEAIILCDNNNDDCGGKNAHGHHKILRIPSHEATILNSAERVPFLVFIEVLVDDDDHGNTSMADLEAMRGLKGGTVTSFSCSPTSSTANIGLLSPNATNYTNTTNSAITDSNKSDNNNNSNNNNHQEMSIEARTPLFEPDSIVDTDDRVAEQMRLAAIMLAQLNRQAHQPNANHKHIDEIRLRLLQEIERLERDGMIDALSRVIITHTNGDVAKGTLTASDSTTNNDNYTNNDNDDTDNNNIGRHNGIRDDPSAAVFAESLEEKQERIKRDSPFGHLPSWRLVSVVVKQGVDMRQELFACHLINMIRSIWGEEGLEELWVSTHHHVLACGRLGGLVETIPDCMSVHSIKKAMLTDGTAVPALRQYFERRFTASTTAYKRATLSFIQSLAAYSLICYALHIKDRHNGNILIDSHGHIIHIDFGFMLTNAPGGNAYMGGLETAPFKLTHDYVELLGGLTGDAPGFAMFRTLFIAGLQALRKHHDRLLLLIDASTVSFSQLPCFAHGRDQVVSALRSRLFLGATDKVVEQSVDRLITTSAYNMFTRLYDSYQYYSNGIL